MDLSQLQHKRFTTSSLIIFIIAKNAVNDHSKTYLKLIQIRNWVISVFLCLKGIASAHLSFSFFFYCNVYFIFINNWWRLASMFITNNHQSNKKKLILQPFNKLWIFKTDEWWTVLLVLECHLEQIILSQMFYFLVFPSDDSIVSH